MKQIKRSVFVLCTMAVAATGLWACSNSDELQASENNTTNTYAQRKGVKVPDYVIQDVNYSMVSFVDGLRDYYKPGMSYDEFKKSLDPDTGLATIRKEADVLLHTAYDNLRYNVKEDKMNGAPMLEFLVFIIEDNMNRGIEDMRTLDLNKESMLAFGLKAENDKYTTSSVSVGLESGDKGKYRDCEKWYRIGCHLGNLWTWITSPSNPSNPNSESNGMSLIKLIEKVIDLIDKIIPGK